LAKEKKLEGWGYVVSKPRIDALLRERGAFLEAKATPEKKPEEKKAE